MDIDNVCLNNIHASILVGNLCGAEGESVSEGLFFDASEDAITQEIKDDHHRLPILGTLFWSLKPGQAIGQDDQPTLGLWGYMVILARIFGKIQDLHQKLSNGVLDEHHAELITQDLAQELETFEQGLPPDLHFTVHNLKKHARVGLGQVFVALHLGHHHYATLLYFPFFDIQLSQTRSRALFVSRCKHHATMSSDLLRTSHETPDCEAVYLIVAHMTMDSQLRLQHVLPIDGEPDIPATSDLAERGKVASDALSILRRKM
ncbi:hypothetical protein PENSUB_11444 [Penicillium subrubescens]|uniref:Uncharacterized protein n=1 Tax=Penicillium subrubescens TaxID=1316194 RepID=A0A1Q5UQD7_9EURO|nr:hypothetical protein PENSUB_11444 [Penicillium subrubescens]